MLFVVVAWRTAVDFWLLAKAAEVLRKLPEILTSHVGYCFERRWLEILETSMIEYFAHGSLQSCTADPRSHERTLLTDNDWSDVSFGERFRVVLLELILVGLCLYLHLLDDANLCANLASILHLSDVAFHSVGESATWSFESFSRKHAHVRISLWHDITFRVCFPLPVGLQVRY